jgi:myo-inositol-1(or 4)-monophosphatase
MDKNDKMEILKELQSLVQEVGEYQLSHFRKVFKTRWKGKYNPVTEIDLESEERLLEGLKKIKKVSCLSEENNPNFIAKGESEYWILDPLDGTVNYSHGFPFFAVSIALAKGNEVKLGIVYAPYHKELFSSDGIHSYLNGEVISVSENHSLDKSLIATGFPYNRDDSKKNNIDIFNKVIPHIQGIRRTGSAALDLCYVACGRFDGFWEQQLNPWDVAAGSLIVSKAGGKIRNFGNAFWNILDDTVIASNSNIFNSLMELILK